jgi:hypothetical protein
VLFDSLWLTQRGGLRWYAQTPRCSADTMAAMFTSGRTRYFIPAGCGAIVITKGTPGLLNGTLSPVMVAVTFLAVVAIAFLACAWLDKRS